MSEPGCKRSVVDANNLDQAKLRRNRNKFEDRKSNIARTKSIWEKLRVSNMGIEQTRSNVANGKSIRTPLNAEHALPGYACLLNGVDGFVRRWSSTMSNELKYAETRKRIEKMVCTTSDVIEDNLAHEILKAEKANSAHAELRKRGVVPRNKESVADNDGVKQAGVRINEESAR